MSCLNDLPMMKLLLEHGADVTITDKGGCTPFYRVYTAEYTSAENRSKAIDVLLDYVFLAAFAYSSNFCIYPLIIASEHSDFPLIERMLQHGADARITNGCGDYVLFCLLRNLPEDLNETEVLKCVKLLVEYGTDVTAKNENCETVFDYVDARSELEALLREYSVDRKPLLK